MTFKRGDKVRIRKPTDTKEGPGWLTEMDNLTSGIHTLVSQLCDRPRWTVEGEWYAIDERWMTLVPKEPDLPKIDWTKPVRGVTSFKPYRVLCTDGGTDWPVILLYESFYLVRVNHFGYERSGLKLVENTPPAPAIDFTKPVQTKSGHEVRILCTDAPGWCPVIGYVISEQTNWPTLWRWDRDGRSWRENEEGLDNLENVPDQKAEVSCSRTFYLYRANGSLGSNPHAGKLWIAVRPRHPKHKLLGKKTVMVTIEEGEGL